MDRRAHPLRTANPLQPFIFSTHRSITPHERHREAEKAQQQQCSAKQERRILNIMEVVLSGAQKRGFLELKPPIT